MKNRRDWNIVAIAVVLTNSETSVSRIRIRPHREMNDLDTRGRGGGIIVVSLMIYRVPRIKRRVEIVFGVGGCLITGRQRAIANGAKMEIGR